MATINGLKVKLFTLNANRSLAQRISNFTGIELSRCDLHRFADGEISVDIEETVRGHHVFIIQPTQPPVNENLMELLIMIDAVKRASSQSVNVVMPYYGYSRQDRKSASRQPISAKLVANLLSVAGASRVISMDLHAGQIQGFFDIPIDNFVGMPILVDYFRRELNNKDLVIVSPDHGGAVRARRMGNAMHAPIAIIDKSRPKPNESEVMNIVGDVKGRTAIIIDDLIDTAGTIATASEALKEAGAEAVYAACTHPVLSPPAMQRIEESEIEEIVCTNTIELGPDKRSEKIVQLDVAPLLGQGILNIVQDKPLSSLFETDE